MVSGFTGPEPQSDLLKHYDRWVAHIDDFVAKYDVPRQPESEQMTSPEGDVSTGCIACARAHFSAIAGTLKEAIRFAREGGITNPEVQSRLQAAEEEVTNVERHDWTPEKVLNSPLGEKRVIQQFVSPLRKLRQQIMQITTVEDLEYAAANAAQLSTDFRLAVLELHGADVKSFRELTSKVYSGEMTAEEARQNLNSKPASEASP